MLTIALFAGALILGQAKASDLHCPVMLEAAPKPAASVDFNGVRFPICCAACTDPFLKSPAQFLKADHLQGKTVGQAMFEPVTGLRIHPKDSKGSSDFAGVRFHFSSVENKRRFDADPKRFGTLPEREALFCAVMNHPLKGGYDKAGGYVDHGAVRYYVCCPSCHPTLKAEPAKHVGKAASAIKAPATSLSPK
jgi:YHS domain-containing protein